jgi:hypothetical protein
MCLHTVAVPWPLGKKGKASVWQGSHSQATCHLTPTQDALFGVWELLPLSWRSLVVWRFKREPLAPVSWGNSDLPLRGLWTLRDREFTPLPYHIFPCCSWPGHCSLESEAGDILSPCFSTLVTWEAFLLVVTVSLQQWPVSWVGHGRRNCWLLSFFPWCPCVHSGGSGW